MIITVDATDCAFRKFPGIGNYVKTNKQGKLIKARKYDKHIVGNILGYQFTTPMVNGILRPAYTIQLLTLFKSIDSSNYIVDMFFNDLGKQNEN